MSEFFKHSKVASSRVLRPLVQVCLTIAIALNVTDPITLTVGPPSAAALPDTSWAQKLDDIGKNLGFDISTLTDEQKKELQEGLDKKEIDPNKQHQKQEPTATPTPSPEPTKPEPQTEQERLQQAGQDIIDSENFDELVKDLPPDTARKFTQAQKEMIAAGLGDVDMRKDLTHTDALVDAMQTKRDSLVDAVLRGEMSEADYLQTMKMDRLALYKQAVGGEALDYGNYGTDFDPGNPTKQTRNDNPGSFHLDQSRKRFLDYLNTSNDILDPNKPMVRQLEGSGMTRSRITRELSLLMADHTANSQGPWGSCWTCAGNQMAMAWRPDDYSKMVQQVVRTGKFVSPYTQQTVAFPNDVLAPSRSNLAYNMNVADNGEQQYTAKIGQYVVGVASGNNQPWDGGVTEYAGRGLKAITGIDNVPWIEMRPGNNNHIPTNQLGGTDGLIKGINNGTVRVAAYIPFPGHAAENSGFLLSSTQGKSVGFGINDNSWGQAGENAFLATQANANKFVFPKGGGTRFSDPLGGGAIGSLGNLNRVIGNMQQQQAMQNAAVQQQAQQSAQQQQALQESRKKQEESVNKLSTKEKRMLRAYCVRNVKASSGIPTACKIVLTDKTLGEYVPREKFDVPLPTGNVLTSSTSSSTTRSSGGALAGI